VRESGQRQSNIHKAGTASNVQVSSGKEANTVVLLASWAVRGDGSGNFLRVDNLWDANTSGITKEATSDEEQGRVDMRARGANKQTSRPRYKHVVTPDAVTAKQCAMRRTITDNGKEHQRDEEYEET